MRLLLSIAALLAAAAQTPPAPAKPPIEKPAAAKSKPAPPGLPAAAPPRKEGEIWKTVWQHDELDAALTVVDFHFFTPERGILAAIENRAGRDRGFLQTTRDGGRTWTRLNFKPLPLALHFLDESTGWLVAGNGLYGTVEGGAAWKKLKAPKGTLRVFFRNAQEGWAFGLGKVFSATTDGGKTWKPVPASEKLALTSDNTAMRWGAMLTQDFGMLVGNARRPRRDRIPDWMDPERVALRRELPGSMISWETRDGGKTWQSSLTSLIGQVQKFQFVGSLGFALFRYEDAFEWPSEVLQITASDGQSSSVFRRHDVMVTDGLLLRDGSLVLAGVQPAGQLRSTPVPGRVRIFGTRDWRNWVEYAVDYKARARRVLLAGAGIERLWAVTDEGLLLQLTPTAAR